MKTKEQITVKGCCTFYRAGYCSTVLKMVRDKLQYSA